MGSSIEQSTISEAMRSLAQAVVTVQAGEFHQGGCTLNLCPSHEGFTIELLLIQSEPYVVAVSRINVVIGNCNRNTKQASPSNVIMAKVIVSEMDSSTICFRKLRC
jgi:hypothetical protein